MNAMPVSPADFVEEGVNGSDSDMNFDDDGGDSPDYYQPISATADDDDDDSGRISDSADEDRHGNGEAEFFSRQLANGGYNARQAEDGMTSLRLNDDVERNKSSSEDEVEGEEEEERVREAADSAITRAFREDENRRNAPLTAENATRVMEAMRGISFGGVAPDWADRVPESHWIDQLRRLRQPPPQA